MDIRKISFHVCAIIFFWASPAWADPFCGNQLVDCKNRVEMKLDRCKSHCNGEDDYDCVDKCETRSDKAIDACIDDNHTCERNARDNNTYDVPTAPPIKCFGLCPN